MKTEFTFKDVCNYIKSDNSGLVEQVDILLGLTIIIAGPVIASQVAPAALPLSIVGGMLGAKNEMTKLGRFVFQKLTRKKNEDGEHRLQRMSMAYGLICFTAFFEAFEVIAPQVANLAGLTSGEKIEISQNAIAKISGTSHELSRSARELVSISDIGITLPHPAGSWEAQNKQLISLYLYLTDNLMAFLSCLSFWDEMTASQHKEILELSQSLPELALTKFHGQYFSLATKYEEFLIWSQLYDLDALKLNLEKVSLYTRKQIALAQSNRKQIDIGFKKLSEAIQSTAANSEAKKIDKTLQELARYYSNAVNEPVWNKKSTSTFDEDEIQLSYPKKSDIFIPQSFKAVRFTGKERLEQEWAWRSIESRENLGSFILSYLSSPYSMTNPLIILGYPGSGKSLLMNMIAAHLIHSQFSPILVTLRNVNPDQEIATQIEQQINDITSRKVSWADLTDYLTKYPALLLFDGYDELLQASGKVFSGYLSKVQKFQETEMALGRQATRTIISSRITLIDKADIPVGTTVIRLEEFDDIKKQKWISVWNATNQSYFKRKAIESFKLPRDNENVKTLAAQPLLLLMLATYDAASNSLRQAQNLDQSVLYNSLLRQFIEREKDKSVDYIAMSLEMRKKDIEREFERLGLVATSMFNRRQLYISEKQLDSDLSFFKLERIVPDSEGRKLSQAELLLGSFFFVYESKARHKANVGQESSTDAAFEFLHNTFGEFLSSDFILKKIISETTAVWKSNKDEDLLRSLEQRLARADAFPDTWFACLIYTPLFTRPVILRMMKEGLEHLLKERGIDIDQFIESFDIIVLNQITRIISSNSLPAIIVSDNRTTVGTLPILGFSAIYTINLIILRTMLAPDGYDFLEEKFPLSLDGTRPWDQLIYLWRAWFSIETLEGLASILEAERIDNTIQLRIRRSFGLIERFSRLDSLLNISNALADNVMSGLVGLQLYDALLPERNRFSIETLRRKLDVEGIELSTDFITKIIRTESMKTSWKEFMDGEFPNITTIYNLDSYLNYGRELLRLLRLANRNDIGIITKRLFHWLVTDQSRFSHTRFWGIVFWEIAIEIGDTLFPRQQGLGRELLSVIFRFALKGREYPTTPSEENLLSRLIELLGRNEAPWEQIRPELQKLRLIALESSRMYYMETSSEDIPES